MRKTQATHGALVALGALMGFAACHAPSRVSADAAAGDGAGHDQAAADVVEHAADTGRSEGAADAADASADGVDAKPRGPSRWVNEGPSPLPADWPEARESHAMAFDEVRGKVVLFGGGTLDHALDDTWEWDGATRTWSNLTPTPRPKSWPSARVSHAMAFDGRRVVMFGGHNRFTGGPNLDDLWAWDGESWENLTPTMRPEAWPEARNAHAMAYDGARGRAVLYSGASSDGVKHPLGKIDDLWDWDGAAGVWSLHPMGTVAPLPRNEHSMAFGGITSAATAGPTTKQLVLFGGSPTGPDFRSNDTWQWDPETLLWTDMTPKTLPDEWPSKRSTHVLGYDFAGKKMIMFGATGEMGEPLQDTWEWDGETWHDRTPEPLPASWPPGRTSPTMSWDGTRLILFGGAGNADGTELLNDVWGWEAS